MCKREHEEQLELKDCAKERTNSPVPTPTVKYRTRTLGAQTVAKRQQLASIEPAIVTVRQPNLFTNILDIGPWEKNEMNYLIKSSIARSLPYIFTKKNQHKK